jgi:D-xylose 1-dehydrogenase (NADP+, D-xylono-1,5-lactone-forming)
VTHDGSSRLRWGILGTARIAAEIVPGLQRSEVNILRAIASRNAQNAAKFAEEYVIESAYASYEALLNDDDIDCVYIPLPNSMHGEWVRRALECGKHVLCEKPLVPSADEAAKLFDLAEQRGRVLAEAFMYRHHPKVQRLVEMVRSRELGDIHTIRSSFNFLTEQPEQDIRFNPALAGGSLRDVGSYCISVSNLVVGEEPEEVVGVPVMSQLGVEERYYGTLRYRSGAVALFDCSMVSPLSVGVSVLGSLGEAHIPMPWYSHRPPHEIRVRRFDGHSYTVAVSSDNPYHLETENFAAAVRGVSDPVIPRQETERNLRTIERLRAAIRASDLPLAR